MDQNPSLYSDSGSARKENHHICCKKEAHYCVHKLSTEPHTEPLESSPGPQTLVLRAISI
jgi:hypothetical protein